MELKKDETPKREESTFSERPSVNDALFGNTNIDSPYQFESSSYSSSSTYSKKSGGSNVIMYAIIVLIVMFVAGGLLNYNRKIKERNGTYELVSVSQYGLTYTVEQLEAKSGMDIYASLTINGSECEVKLDYTYIKTEGVGKIKFNGNKIKITDCSETLTGQYNPSSKTITLESNGGELNFQKVD